MPGFVERILRERGLSIGQVRLPKRPVEPDGLPFVDSGGDRSSYR
jgi:hypothetical protein